MPIELVTLLGSAPCAIPHKSTIPNNSNTVGLKKPNPAGIFDMHGNVWEWCSDWYGEKLSGGTDPVGHGSGSDRVLRGCCWRGGPDLCRSADRSSSVPSDRAHDLGFRVARSQLAQ